MASPVMPNYVRWGKENVMKKLLSLMLACMLMCGLSVPGAFAEEHEGLFTYKVLEDGTAEITETTDGDIIHLEIPAEIDGYKVTSIGTGAFWKCFKLVSAIIPEGVVFLKSQAFTNSNLLESISIPDSLEVIGSSALRSQRLTEVILSPDHPVFAVENEALINRQDGTLVRFLAPEETGSYEITPGIRKIMGGAFEFARISSLVIPDSVTTIHSEAFSSCKRLQSVNIPDSVTTIEAGVFDHCSSLTSIEISPDHPVYECLGLTVADKHEKKIIAASCAIQGKYVIPEGVRAIGSYAFNWCSRIEELYIPDSVTEIGKNAFFYDTVIRGCAGSAAQQYCGENNRYRFTEMTTEDFAEAVKVLDGPKEYEAPFTLDSWRAGRGSEVSGPYRYDLHEDGTATITYADPFIKDGNIPAELDGHKVNAIAGYAFSSCSGLKKVVIPEGVISVGNGAFEGCIQLETICIPYSLVNISGDFVSSCPRLKNFEIAPGHLTLKIENNALIDYRNDTLIFLLDRESTGTYTVSPGIRRLAGNVFAGSKYSAIILPDSLETIDNQAFMSCSNLKELVLPEGVKEIDIQPFYDCQQLETINIPDSVTFINTGIFGNCKNLKTVKISPDHPAYEMIDHLLVDKRNKVLVSALNSMPEKYELPEGITEIGEIAFQGSEELTELIVPEGVTKIGSNAFSGCYKLRKITLPASMEEIGSKAFFYSYHLVIKAPEGSWAEKYCKENGYEFEGMKNEK